MKNSKIPNDVKFIDPQTGQVVCTWNTCKDKFKPGHIEKRTIFTKSLGPDGVNVEFDFHAHKCDECGRLFQTTKDASAGKKSYKLKLYEMMDSPKKN